ncbi:hypothetical protein J1N35_029253, partial [Gossypium stocksii]
MLLSSWYSIITHNASQKVIQSQLGYETIWIFRSGETHRGYVVTVGTQSIQSQHVHTTREHQGEKLIKTLTNA